MKRYFASFLMICSIFLLNTSVWASENFDLIQEETNLLKTETRASNTYTVNLTQSPKDICRHSFTGSVGHHKVTVTNHINGSSDIYVRIIDPYGKIIIYDKFIRRGETVEIGNVYESEYIVQALCSTSSGSKNTLTVKYTPYALVR